MVAVRGGKALKAAMEALLQALIVGLRAAGPARKLLVHVLCRQGQHRSTGSGCAFCAWMRMSGIGCELPQPLNFRVDVRAFVWHLLRMPPHNFRVDVPDCLRFAPGLCLDKWCSAENEVLDALHFLKSASETSSQLNLTWKLRDLPPGAFKRN